MAAETAPASCVIRVGWFEVEPYRYIETRGEAPILKGFDVEMIETALARIGCSARFEEVAPFDQIAGLKAGTIDAIVGAQMPSMEPVAMFSAPIRLAEAVIVVREPDAPALRRASSPQEVLASFVRDERRMAMASFPLMPDRLLHIMGKYYGEVFVTTPTLLDSFRALAAGQVDAVVCESVSGALLTRRFTTGLRPVVLPGTLFSLEVQVAFSRRTVTPEFVARFDTALKELARDGTRASLSRSYSWAAVIAALTAVTGAKWFFAIDILGTIAFALSGLLLARSERYDIFGAFVLAALPAVGGGVVRDLLVSRRPLTVMRTPVYLFLVIGTVLAGFLVFRIVDRVRRSAHNPLGLLVGRPTTLAMNMFGFCDALGLAAYTVTGVLVAVESRTQPLWLWGALLAALTAAGGGVLRDILRADANNPSLKGMVYPEIPLLWGLAFAVFLDWATVARELSLVPIAIVATIAGALATRLLVMHFRIASPFLYDPRQSGPDAVLRLVDRQQLDLLRCLPAFLDTVRADRPANAEPVAEAYSAFVKAAVEPETSLGALERDILPPATSRRLVALRGRQGLIGLLAESVRSLAELVAEIRLAARTQTGPPAGPASVPGPEQRATGIHEVPTAALGHASEPIVEGLHALLVTHVEALASGRAGDAGLTPPAAQDRATLVHDLRVRYVTGDPRVDARLVHLAALCERAIWLATRIAAGTLPPS